jgi:hypothetical protein
LRVPTPENRGTHLGEHSVSCACFERLGWKSEPGQDDHARDLMRSLSNELQRHGTTLRETEKMDARDVGVFRGERIEPSDERAASLLGLIQITRERTRDGVYRDGEPGPAGSGRLEALNSGHHEALGQVRHEAEEVVGVCPVSVQQNE